MHIEVPAVAFKDLSTAPPGTSSDVMRQEVLAARSIQRQRFDGTRTRYNAQMSTREIRKHCRLDEDCLEILRSSVNELGLSARALRWWLPVPDDPIAPVDLDSAASLGR